jgi:hypothetical protein
MAYNPDLPAGTYRAKAKDAGTYTSRNGALMLAVLWEIAEGEWAGCTITSRDCLVTTAGQLMDKKIDLTREWAPGWDGVNLEWFKANYQSFDVEIVVERKEETYNGKTEVRPNVSWINPPDGGGHGIPSGDARSLSAKFGAKLRAYAASKPKPAQGQPQPSRTPQIAVKPPLAQPGGLPPEEPPTPEEPETPERTAKQLMEEAYSIHCNQTATLSKEEQTKKWFEVVARITPRKDYAAFPPDIWEKVLEELRSDIPF